MTPHERAQSIIATLLNGWTTYEISVKQIDGLMADVWDEAYQTAQIDLSWGGDATVTPNPYRPRA